MRNRHSLPLRRVSASTRSARAIAPPPNPRRCSQPISRRRATSGGRLRRRSTLRLASSNATPSSRSGEIRRPRVASMMSGATPRTRSSARNARAPLGRSAIRSSIQSRANRRSSIHPARSRSERIAVTCGGTTRAAAGRRSVRRGYANGAAAIAKRPVVPSRMDAAVATRARSALSTSRPSRRPSRPAVSRTEPVRPCALDMHDDDRWVLRPRPYVRHAHRDGRRRHLDAFSSLPALPA